MALKRDPDYPMLEPPNPPRRKHKVTPIIGEYGRYMVDSHSMLKRGKEGAYIVDLFEKEQTDQGAIVTGTCACKGWQIRKTCSHLIDAQEVHQTVYAKEQSEDIGL